VRKFGDNFVAAADHELTAELELRGYKILYPVQERGSAKLAMPGPLKMDTQRVIKIA
jgi:hypothetical protein